ncbi:MAG: ECF-type sigma factor [Thermoanaerobaculia bacterium]
MADEPRNRESGLAAAIAAGGPEAAEQILPAVYEELRRLARARMARERPGLTLTPTALVHEAYLRLAGDSEVRWDGRGHFFAAAAEAMRRILIERARRVARQKHGGDRMRVTLVEGLVGVDPEADEFLALDEALSRLEAIDPEMAEVVKLHQFAGLSLAETAAATGTSERTVSRRWTAARTWLRRELERGDPARG